MAKKSKKIGLSIKIGLIIVCIALLVPSLINAFPFLVGGENSYVVLSGSMEPTMKPGDLVITRTIDPQTIKTGDIVSVDAGSYIYTHRVVEKKTEDGKLLFKLQGDSNEDPDASYITSNQIIGETFLIIPLGFIGTKQDTSP